MTYFLAGHRDAALTATVLAETCSSPAFAVVREDVGDTKDSNTSAATASRSGNATTAGSSPAAGYTALPALAATAKSLDFAAGDVTKDSNAAVAVVASKEPASRLGDALTVGSFPIAGSTDAAAIAVAAELLTVLLTNTTGATADSAAAGVAKDSDAVVAVAASKENASRYSSSVGGDASAIPDAAVASSEASAPSHGQNPDFRSSSSTGGEANTAPAANVVNTSDRVDWFTAAGSLSSTGYVSEDGSSVRSSDRNVFVWNSYSSGSGVRLRPCQPDLHPPLART